MVISMERGADLPLTVSCFSEIQIGFTFLVLAHPDSPGKRPLNGCVCVCLLFLAPSVKALMANLLTDKCWPKHYT